MHFNRRHFVGTIAGQLAMGRCLLAEPSSATTIGFGFGTYGMRSLAIEQAIRTCSEIGYDGLEIALLNGWPTEPTQLSKQRRKELKQQLVEARLAVPSLLESLPCLGSVAQQRSNIERLKRATDLALDLSPDRPPVVQSIVGGSSNRWERDKQRLVEQLADWAEVAKARRVVVCFKPHASHIVDDIERALWLHRTVGSPWLKTVYDYSHFHLKGLGLAESVRQLLPITPYIQVKDSRGTPPKHEYLLPGDGSTDYAEMLSILKASNYSGFVNVEVSSMIHRKPAYDPVATARLCYQRLAPIFEQVGIARPIKRSRE